jgi:hypothetical protein
LDPPLLDLRRGRIFERRHDMDPNIDYIWYLRAFGGNS